MAESNDVPSLTWQPAPTGPVPLANHEVHLICARLPVDAAALPTLQAHLSPEELLRASRFHFDRDRRRFIAARGLLREILAGYTEQCAADLRIVEGGGQKPVLAQDPRSTGLRFNISHSGDLCLFAVARNREVGVDLEALDARVAAEDIAERFFSPGEVAALRQLPPIQRQEAFLNCWTRKEAYVKARGEGLAIPLGSFEVSLAPGEPPRLIRVAGHPEEPAKWQMVALEPDAGYVGALVAEGHDLHIRCWRQPPI